MKKDAKVNIQAQISGKISELAEQRNSLLRQKNAIDTQAADLGKQIEALEEEQREEQGKVIVEHIDAFLALVPEHCRTSCSDSNLSNIGRCYRCALLEAKRSGYWDADYRISIGIVRV